MNRDEKAAVVEEIAQSLSEAEAIFAVDYRGITVPQADELRGKLAEADAVFKVVKNRLAKLAAEKAGAGDLNELLQGPIALTLIKGDAVTAAKAISTFSRQHDVLEFKGGIMDGAPLDPDEFKAIARLPALDVLRGQFVGVTASPLTGLARGLGSILGGLALALGQVQEEGLVEGEAPAEEPEEPPAEETPAEDAEASPEEGDTEAPAGASDEIAVQEAEPAAPSEPEPAGTGREAEDLGGVVDDAEQAAEPAAPSEPEPAGTGREAEDLGGVVDVAVQEAEPAAPSEPETAGPGREAEEPAE